MEAPPPLDLGGVQIAITAFRMFACANFLWAGTAIIIGFRKKRSQRAIGGVVIGGIGVAYAVGWLLGPFGDLDMMANSIHVFAAVAGLAGGVLCAIRKNQPNQTAHPTTL